MVAEDIADDELAAGLSRDGNDALGIGDGLGQRLLDKDIGAGLHGLNRIVGMGIRPGADGNHIGLERCQRLVVVGEAAGTGQCLRQSALGDVALADADDIEAVDARIGERVAQPHIAEPDGQDPLLRHLLLPSPLLPRHRSTSR